MKNNLTLIVTENADGWLTGQVAEFPEAISQGKDIDELKENILDALQLLFTARQEFARKQFKSLHTKTYKLPFCNA